MHQEKRGRHCKCAFAYAKAIENCDFARDDKIRLADEQLLVDLSNCHPGDKDCIKAANDKHTQPCENADSEYTKCSENVNSTKTKYDANAEAAHTRRVKDAEDERYKKKLEQAMSTKMQETLETNAGHLLKPR